MDFQRLINQLSHCYLKDINIILEKMFNEYDIFYKDNNEKVQLQHILEKFELAMKLCKGVSQNGNKCCNKVLGNTDYCKVHQYLQFRNRETTNVCKCISKNGNKCCNKSIKDSYYCKTHMYLQFKHENEMNENNQNNLFIIDDKISDEYKEDLKHILVEDTFYYTDDQYIYDTETFQKVGYVELNSDNKYILTDDPFILGTF
jgi:hypothetical protein